MSAEMDFDFDSYVAPYQIREPDKDLLAFFKGQPSFYLSVSNSSVLGKKKTIGCEYGGNVYGYDIEGSQLIRTVYVGCRVEFTKLGEPRILDLKEPTLRSGKRRGRFSLEVHCDFAWTTAEETERFNALWSELIAHIERFTFDKQLDKELSGEKKARLFRI